MGWPEKITHGPVFTSRYFAKKWITLHGDQYAGHWGVQPLKVYDNPEEWEQDNADAS